MKIRGVSEALAVYLGWDVSDVREYRYHYGRTGTLQLFTIGSEYLTACKIDKKGPPKCHDDEYNFNWKCLDENFYGWKIFSYTPISTR